MSDKTLLLFTGKGCVPCTVVKAILRDLQEVYKFKMREIHASAETKVEFSAYGVRSVPTVVCIDEDGNILGRFSGASANVTITDQLRKWRLIK